LLEILQADLFSNTAVYSRLLLEVSWASLQWDWYQHVSKPGRAATQVVFAPRLAFRPASLDSFPSSSVWCFCRPPNPPPLICLDVWLFTKTSWRFCSISVSPSDFVAWNRVPSPAVSSPFWTCHVAHLLSSSVWARVSRFDWRLAAFC
jgi:hypothetical protein